MARRDASFRVKVLGIGKTIRRFRSLREETRKELLKALRESAGNVKRAAQDKVPVRSGALKRSITRRASKRKLIATVRARAPHSAVIEFGAPRLGRPAKPFLVPATSKERPVLEAKVREILRKVPRRVARK